MDSFIAKQAITDENLTIVGYELLFRNSEKIDILKVFLKV